MSELKPCPMCGATDLDMIVDIVQCRECGLTIAKDSAEEAIAAWNTRPGEDKLQERIDALESLATVAREVAVSAFPSFSGGRPTVDNDAIVALRHACADMEDK